MLINFYTFPLLMQNFGLLRATFRATFSSNLRLSFCNFGYLKFLNNNIFNSLITTFDS